MLFFYLTISFLSQLYRDWRTIVGHSIYCTFFIASQYAAKVRTTILSVTDYYRILPIGARFLMQGAKMYRRRIEYV